MKKALSLTFRVLLIAFTPGLLTTTNAWAQQAPRMNVVANVQTTTSSIPDTTIKANAVADVSASQIVPAMQEVQPPPRQQPFARYNVYDAKLAKRLSKQVPDLRGVTLGFDGPVSGQIRAALIIKYPGIRVEENCDARPVICVFFGRTDSKGYWYGSAYDDVSGYNARGGPNASKSNSYAIGSSYASGGQVLSNELNVVLYTEEFRPQWIGFVSSQAFVGTSYSGGNYYGSDWNSRSSQGGYRSNGASYGDSSYESQITSENEALRASVDNGVKRLFQASLDSGTANFFRNIDNSIKPAWMPYANEAISRAFGANR